MSTNKFEELGNKVVDLLGGKDNIKSMLHCVTRLRFNVIDKDKVNVEEIEKIGGVIGTNWSGNQIQLIIGQSVADAYALVNEKYQIDEGSVQTEEEKTEKKKFSVNTILDGITGSVIPSLPLLIGGGFIKVFVVILSMIGVLPVDSASYTVLSFVGDAAFYFLPIYIGYNAAKKFGSNPQLGMLMGAILVHPTFLQAVNEGTALSIAGLPIRGVNYTSSVLPVILTCAIMAPIEKFFAKHSPDALRVMLEPFLTILVMVPLSLCVLSPLGAFIGDYLAAGMNWIYNTIGFAGVALLSTAYPFLVMTGMHGAFTPFIMNSLLTTGTESFFMPAATIACINQGVASLAVGLKSKNTELKSTAVSSAVTGITSGVIEPAMYGVNFRFKKPMYMACIGSMIGAAVAGIGHATLYTMAGSTGALALPAFISPVTSEFIMMIAGTLIGAVVTFVLTTITYKEA